MRRRWRPFSRIWRPPSWEFSSDSNIVGGTTSSGHVTIVGHAASNATLQIFDGYGQVGTATADASGKWTFTTGPLSNGAHSFAAIEVDVAGTKSLLSSSVPLTVAVSQVAPAILGFSPDGGVAGDGITNVNHVTLTGTAAAGTTVQVFDGAKQIGTATANASGAWSLATGTLADGSHAFTSKAVDAAGNISAASAALTVTIDTVAPSAPTVAAFSPDSAVAGDGITNVNHVALTGTAAAGTMIQVFDGATQIGTATATASGAWSLATGTLADGSHAFTSKAVDAAGNISAASKALTVTIDTVAPSAPTVASFSPDSAVAGDGITNVNHVTLTGTAAAGTTIQVFDGATQIGTATATASGAWSLATGTLADGSHAFTSKAVDAAGNISAASKALTVTIDTAAPSAPTVASFSLDSAVAGDGITNVNHVTLTGTAAAGTMIQVFDGATQIGTATATASGAWSLATGTLADGSHAFTSKAVDAAGNISAASKALTVTIDTAAPSAPTVASFSPDSAVAGDGITNVNHVALTGTAAAGTMIQVFDGATQIGTATATASGAWSLATGTLADGSHAFTSKAVDAAGNISAASKALTVTIDTAAPSAPTVASFSPDSAVAGDGITNVNHVTLTGTAAAGTMIQVFDGATQIGTATATASGAWSLATGTLADGVHAFTTKATDAAGNVSVASAELDVTVNTAWSGNPSAVSVVHIDNLGTARSTDLVTIDGNTTKTIHLDTSGHMLSAEVSAADGASTTTMYFDASWHQTKADIVTVNGNEAKTVHLDANWQVTSADITSVDANSATTIQFNSAWQQTGAEISTINGVTTQTIYFDAKWTVTGAEIATVEGHSTTLTYFDANWKMTGAAISDPQAVTSFDANWHQAQPNSAVGQPALNVMSGTADNDVFVFRGNFGSNVITNFQTVGASHDVIQLDHTTFSDFNAIMASAVQSGDNVVITAHEGSVILEGMQLAGLHPYDFHLV
ncbi:Ig-like domain-containing protein [Bradyrhizobium sp. LB13.1]